MSKTYDISNYMYSDGSNKSKFEIKKFTAPIGCKD